MHSEFPDIKICNKWLGVSSNQNTISYLNEMKMLVSYSVKDIRNKIVNPQIEFKTVADFVFDKDSLAVLQTDGKGRFDSVLATGEWVNNTFLWSTIIKLEKCWVFMAWEKERMGNHFISINFDGQFIDRGFLQANCAATGTPILSRLAYPPGTWIGEQRKEYIGDCGLPNEGVHRCYLSVL